MNHFNFSVIEGTLDADPRVDGKGHEFVINSTRSYTKKTGERVEEVQAVMVYVDGRLGETCATYLKKGSRVLVSGVLRDCSAGGLGMIGREVNFLSKAAS